MVQYLCRLLRPGQPGAFLFCTPGLPGRASAGNANLPIGVGIGSLQQAIPKLNSKETFMSSLSAKDRVSLCSFTFSDGRRCRAPRVRDNPCFCPYHAQKEARARAAQKLGKDLDYFFSGDYLSACDLSTALARLIPAVVRGDVKPKTAHTVAYLAQTLMQSIHISEQEYINTFGTDGWREAVRNSVNGNRDYLFPPTPEPEPSESLQPQPQPQPAPVAPVAHPFRGEAVSSPLPPNATPSSPSAPTAATPTTSPAQPQIGTPTRSISTTTTASS